MAGPAGLVVMGQGRRVGRWAWLLAAILLTELVFLYRVDILNSPLIVSSVGSLKYLSLPDLQDSGPGGLVLDEGWITSTKLGSGLEGKLEPRSDNTFTAGDRHETSADLVNRPDVQMNKNDVGESCENLLREGAWLELKRDFSQQPILVASGETQDWKLCAVPCVFKNSFLSSEHPDAAFGWGDGPVQRVLRSMESSSYYADNDVDVAHRKGYDVVMTTSLASDVPVGYFSWAEYDLMSPVQPKQEKSMAAAFISNCGAHNFRLNAVHGLMSEGVTVDSYGACLHNHGDRGSDKLEALRNYKFSLAFENSNVDDYVTEKFWQSLVAGSVPVVVGAPNIHDFEPAPNAIIQIKEEEDILPAANHMKYLASNETAYNESLWWKVHGPTDAFKALVDMAAVHSSCRLCIHLATKIQMNDELSANRSCQCFQNSNVMQRVFVRERGRFEMETIFIRSSNLTVEVLEQAVLKKFTSMKYVPVWKLERPSVIRGDDDLRIYRIYPVGLTQRAALYSWNFHTTQNLEKYMEENPCPKFEVIFV